VASRIAVCSFFLAVSTMLESIATLSSMVDTARGKVASNNFYIFLASNKIVAHVVAPSPVCVVELKRAAVGEIGAPIG
jgi:hypothetical protein